jgi:hypothetical protein
MMMRSSLGISAGAWKSEVSVYDMQGGIRDNQQHIYSFDN